ncbi:MAG: hypothetical protein O2788_03205 [Chloroflexi bacterium]|nr:hypothetical protein [Chloroflexota bacterium]
MQPGIINPSRHLGRLLSATLAACALVAVIGCGSDMPSAAQTDRPAASQEPAAPEWTVVGDGLDITLATPDLGVGEQRFALVLSDQQGLIKLPVVEFTTYRYPDGYDGPRQGPVENKLARFSEFPFRTRGIHVTNLSFDATGEWGVEARAPRTDGSMASAEVRFNVAEHSRSIAVGEPAPPSRNRTLADVSNVYELTTGSLADESLYQTTIADALNRQHPFVVVFASPAFCTSAVCGPQVEVVSELRAKFGSKADFIHVDLYENPQEIQGNLASAITSPLLAEWGLTSQEWTYVVGVDGKVAARFENFVGADELEQAIAEAVENTHSS